MMQRDVIALFLSGFMLAAPATLPCVAATVQDTTVPGTRNTLIEMDVALPVERDLVEYHAAGLPTVPVSMVLITLAALGLSMMSRRGGGAT